jgi:hypothetical protein
VVGGCGRSGTTLMRVMLDSHPNICCGPESNLLLPRSIRPRVLEEKFDISAADAARCLDASRSQAEFIDAFFAGYCRMTGKERWAEKTPDNVRQLPFLFRHFPKARFVHMLRDGRDVVCSLRTHPSHKIVNGVKVKLDTLQPLDTCITRWLETVQLGLAMRDDPRTIEVRYEDLVDDPEGTLRSLLDFLEEPWDAAVLDYHREKSGSRDEMKNPLHPGIHKPVSSRSRGRWKKDMTAADADRFKERAGELLIELGYAENNDWHPDT